MTVDLSKFGTMCGKNYGEPLDDPVCVCGFEKAISAGQLIESGDPVHTVMYRIDQLSTCQPAHSLMVSLFFVTKLLTTQVTGQESPAGNQFHCLPGEILKAEPFLGCF